MNRVMIAVAGVLAAVVLVVAWNSLFILDQKRQALILQFGQPIREIREPGLQAMVPFLQNVVFFDRRVLDFEPQPEEVIAADQKRLVVDTYTRYRIVDPLQFYKSVGTERDMNLRLGSTVSGALRRVIGNVVLAKLLSPDRAKIMLDIRNDVASQARNFGIEVVDLRIRRADLPVENSQAIYARMQSEREREAKEFRAQGAEYAQGIRARADRERTVILAEAARQAQVSRGQGDAESIRIYADAFNQDPQFYSFYRSLQSYRDTLGGEGTTLLLSPDDAFFKFFDRRNLPGK